MATSIDHIGVTYITGAARVAASGGAAITMTAEDGVAFALGMPARDDRSAPL